MIDIFYINESYLSPFPYWGKGIAEGEGIGAFFRTIQRKRYLWRSLARCCMPWREVAGRIRPLR